MTSVGAVLVAPAEDEQDELRLWDGFEVPAPAPASPPPLSPPGDGDRPDDHAAPAGRAPLEPPSAATLEDLIAGAWDGLLAGVASACPVCREPLRPRWSAGAGVVGGRCESCGTAIS